MRIRELGDGDGRPVDGEEQEDAQVVRIRAKRALVGAGARVLFYPTLLYNVLRNQFEAEFRWWDRVDQVVTLPFKRDSAICLSRTMGSLVVCQLSIDFFFSCSISSLGRLLSLDNRVLPVKDATEHQLYLWDFAVPSNWELYSIRGLHHPGFPAWL